MPTTPAHPSSSPTESQIKGILEWLALVHGRLGDDDAERMQQHLMTLRDASIPSGQRIRLLDLLFGHTKRIVEAEWPRLRKTTLPVPRRLRQRTRTLLALLELLTQDYFNTLAELFDPDQAAPKSSPHNSLRRATCAICWRITIAQLIAAPPAPGVWQQLHGAFNKARHFKVETLAGPQGEPSIQTMYLRTLLVAIAQPASFSSPELEFIRRYVELCTPLPALSTTAPAQSSGLFWADPDKDFPAHALIRRIPGADATTIYIPCDEAAAAARQHRTQLASGGKPEALGLSSSDLPPNATGILQRLSRLWGSPARRRFTRRRQSYRASLCIGLGNLRQLIGQPEIDHPVSEWMVTNESPDGYALMHMSGQTGTLSVGDIVAVQPQERTDEAGTWHVCIIRWAQSENPEHLELGLQILSSQAIPAEVAAPGSALPGKVAALVLPATPPLRPTQLLVVPNGTLQEGANNVVVLMEGGKLGLQEVDATGIDEQTAQIEIFKVSPAARH